MSHIFSPKKLLNILILFELTNGPLHGYALTSSFEEKYGWKPSQTQIYNVLKSMEKEKIVISEEKIEKGRVQKIYSITEKGRSLLNHAKDKTQNILMNKFSQLLFFMQNFSGLEKSEESETFHNFIGPTLRGLKEISCITFLLLKVSPEETQKIIADTISSLKEIAIKNNVQYDNCNEKCE